MIEVILLQSDKHLGEKFEVINVKPIFARNVLFPKKIAVMGNLGNKNAFAQKMKAAEWDRKKKAEGLEDLFTKMHADGPLVLVRKANQEGTLYAKIDENDIVNKIQEAYGIAVEAHYFHLKKKIQSLGQFVVPFLYKELKKEVLIKIDQDPEEEKKLKKTSEKHPVAEASGEEEAPKKTREQIKAEKEAERKAKKEETIKRLKEKYK